MPDLVALIRSWCHPAPRTLEQVYVVPLGYWLF